MGQQIGTDILVRLDPGQLKEIVENSVREHLIQTLSKDPDAVVKAVVDAALKAPSNSYDRNKTLFKDELERQIRELAKDIVTGILTEERPRIEAELRRRITAESLTEAALSQTIDQLGHLYISIEASARVNERADS